MNKFQMESAGRNLFKGFPDVYVYTKRMAEEMLAFRCSQSPLPMSLIFVRPSVLSAADSEPMPGWVDTQGLLAGVTLAIGLGVMKQMPGNPDAFLDIIPVDYAARHLLVAIPYARSVQQHQQSSAPLIV